MYKMNFRIKKLHKMLILTLILVMTSVAVHAESLFMMGVSSNNYVIEPRPLYSSVRARAVGDLITVQVDETVTTQDNLTYSADRSSNTTNNFTGLINSILPGRPLTGKLNEFGGGNTVESTTKNNRSFQFTDSIAAQVVQLLPNGNLVIQGKKTIINTNERIDVLMSGVVDPRWINDLGEVSSKNIANLQFAMNGSGSVSRSGGEGIINRFIRYLF